MELVENSPEYDREPLSEGRLLLPRNLHALKYVEDCLDLIEDRLDIRNELLLVDIIKGLRIGFSLLWILLDVSVFVVWLKTTLLMIIRFKTLFDPFSQVSRILMCAAHPNLARVLVPSARTHLLFPSVVGFNSVEVHILLASMVSHTVLTNDLLLHHVSAHRLIWEYGEASVELRRVVELHVIVAGVRALKLGSMEGFVTRVRGQLLPKKLGLGLHQFLELHHERLQLVGGQVHGTVGLQTLDELLKLVGPFLFALRVHAVLFRLGPQPCVAPAELKLQSDGRTA